MKFITGIASILSILIIATSASATPEFGWSISASSTDPLLNTSASTGNLRIVYLWYMCNTSEGIAAAEFDLGGSLTVFTTEPMNGFLNAGTETELFLAIGGCPSGPIAAASLIVGDFSAGDLCLVPSAANGINASFDCSATPAFHANTWVGFSSGGAACRSTSSLCQEVTSVEETSWGEIKSLYR